MFTASNRKRANKSVAIISYALFALSFVSFQASAQTIYQDANLVMGYIESTQTANVSGYNNCFTSVGDYLFVRSDNSANIEPNFRVFPENGQIKITKNSHASGRGAYVCHKNTPILKEVVAGYASNGTTIGKNLSCVLSIANFTKQRVASGTVPGSFTCAYNSSTGKIEASATEAGLVPQCGYVCVSSAANKVSNVISRYYNTLSGTENIGANHQCALGTNYFQSECSGLSVSAASYNSTTGVATKGVSGGCTRSSHSYFCLDTTASTPACANSIDDDGDGLIDFPADPDCSSATDTTEETAPQNCDLQGILLAGDTDTPLKNLRPFVNLDNTDGHSLNDPNTIPANSPLRTMFNSLGYLRGNATIRSTTDSSLLSRTTNSTVKSRYGAYSEIVEFGSDGNSIGSPGGALAESVQPGVLGGAYTVDSVKAESTGISGTKLSNDPSSNRSLINATVDGSASSQKLCELVGFRRVLGANYRTAFTSASNNSQIIYSPATDRFSLVSATSAPTGFLSNTQLDHLICADPILPARCLAACANGLDDDGDGLVDTADPGCSSATDTTETNPNGPACDNGVDDDGDSLIDVAQDPGCSGRTDTTETNPTGPACDNGLDDDGDTLADFAQDPGCSGPTDTTETNPTGPACDNGVDDDFDGLRDVAQDPGCTGPTDTTETDPNGPACTNGVDDDGDSLTDFPADPGCSSASDTTETNPTGPACDNSTDDDGDSLIDFPRDPGCSGVTDTTETNATGPACDNGIDDDGDSLIDVAQDPGCSGPTDTSERNPIGAACDNGVDDDSDARTDFPADPGCSSVSDTTEINPNGHACDNGVDDDLDNFTDSADPGCSGPTDTTETNPSGSQCDNGADDDGDGLVDVQDPQCWTDQTNPLTHNPADTNEAPRQFAACANAVRPITAVSAIQSVIVYEKSESNTAPLGFVVTPFEFPISDSRLRLDIAEGPGTSDFSTVASTQTPAGYYDIFFSDASGVLDVNGSYITIDNFHAAQGEVGNNIDAVTFKLSNGQEVPAEVVSHVELGSVSSGFRNTFLANSGFASQALGSPNVSGTFVGDLGSSLTLGYCGLLSTTPPACLDGVDNDSDGLTDLADPGCSSPTDTTETDPTGPACDNSLDDDGDGLRDFAQDPGCSGPTDTTETNPAGPACDNGLDDDGDALRDLAQDPGCSSVTDTSETDPTSPACDNGVDDDGDGLIDLAQDPGCSSVTDTTETNPAGPACDNGLDDDGDALRDLAQDPGCSSVTDTTETNPTGPACDNGLDDDGDALRDFAQDPGCSSVTDTTETNPTGPACDNGLDDDGDSLRDVAQDPGCSGPTDTTETNPTGPACDNGVDDDGDTLTDFAQDPGCSSVTDTTETNPAGPACDNGVDDDGDTLIDRADPGCSSSTDTTETNPTGPACDNGIDDDGDTLVDRADPGCSGPTDTTETNPAGPACDNGLDDDGDTFVDLLDPGCSSRSDTTETNPSGPACDNGIDDDGDSRVDVAQDPGCTSVIDTTETNPSGPACDNAIDDDSDGRIDFAQDPGCSGPTDTTETNPAGPACDNGTDDDGDTLVDVAQDPGCSGPTDTTETNPTGPACDNGVDDDGDTLIDRADPGCSSPVDTTETNPAGPACDNGLDDDGDALIDLAQDPGCSSRSDTTETNPSGPACDNGLDDDGDTLIDRADPGCSSSTDTTETNPTGPACDNGLDDDGDTLIDRADPGCSGPTDTTETNPTGPACDNAIDDDNDGLVDRADPGCSGPTDTTETNPTGPDCDNGLDDDVDGRIDAADPDCSGPTDTSEFPADNPVCSNAADDDGDGLTDFPIDPGCASANDTSETNASGPDCDNGLDDDGDGLRDLAQDPGCSSVTDTTETNPQGPQCDNGIDDDSDGLVDLAQDPGCSSVTDTTENENVAPSIPQNVSASDGTDPNLVAITWNAVSGATSYQIFRSDLAGNQGAAIGTSTGTSFDDTSAAPGVVYFYSVVARNSAGSSAPSAQDSGFVRDSVRLISPVFTKFNTFLNQMNFLELVSSGTKAIDVKVTIYSLRGQVIKTKNVRVGARSELDLAINDEVAQGCSFVNPLVCIGIDPKATYGLVKLEFDSGDPDKTLLGRMSNYRLDPTGDSYSFAFAKELRNPVRGRSFTAANTFDPQGMGFLVPNWAEIINLSSSNKTFFYRLYTQDGTRVFSRTFVLRPLEERDVQAGHEIFDSSGSVREGVYLAEIVPQDQEAQYLFSVTRYSSNAPVGTVPTSYNFAFSLDARSGASGTLFAPITNENRDADCAFATNWLEVVNVQDVATGASIIFRGQNGAALATQRIGLGAKSQFHFNASALFPTKGIGTAEIRPDSPGAIVSQSLAYFNDLCGLNQVQTAYVSPALPRGIRSQAGTLNTFVQMENALRVYATSSNPGAAIFNLTSFRGGSSSGIINLSSFASNEVQISSNPLFNFPADTNGLVMLDTAADGQAIAQVLRVRRQVGADGRRRLDFIMPTMVR